MKIINSTKYNIINEFLQTEPIFPPEVYRKLILMIYETDGQDVPVDGLAYTIRHHRFLAMNAPQKVWISIDMHYESDFPLVFIHYTSHLRDDFFYFTISNMEEYIVSVIGHELGHIEHTLLFGRENCVIEELYAVYREIDFLRYYVEWRGVQTPPIDILSLIDKDQVLIRDIAELGED